MTTGGVMAQCSTPDRAATLHDGRGFTLVELLVAMAVLALLMATLLVVLPRARGAARSVACAANLSQMVRGAHAHVAQYGFVPPPSRALDYPQATVTCPLDRAPKVGRSAGSSYDSLFLRAVPGENESGLRLWTARLDQDFPSRVEAYWDTWEERDKRLHNNYAYYDGHVANRPVTQDY
jgi:prepilin-type N-terminal cleavage/methylation domain-containing protein/prepilin-type processing-associated H-X9-DG protein